ncbi:cation diffusion facilitator family transporter [Paenibacillus qinlingensis]|uniref:cation diffusion facilitator family transporter n=1 Tax=Paenibacillus qinlingensis TaxID=1837343 RepID=UPI001564AC6A|nr:cation diffusion facilitator family transporter [Paenibacillus qinlingensis]NQX60973.1 cation diffusion facilitator family transporter [Paenibacillus qinlingensis]
MNDEGFRKTEYALWSALLVLTILACSMGIVGIRAHSNSLIAAAAQSAAGICIVAAAITRVRTMRVQLAGASFRGLEPQISVSSLLFIVLILLIGAELAVISVKSLINQVEYEASLVTFAVLVISLLAKEGMFYFLSKRGMQLGTEEFIANARRRRSDIYSSFVVIVGVLSTMLAQALGFNAFTYVDTFAGLIVALFIGKMGFSLVNKTISTPTEKVLHQEEAADYVKAIQKIHGVITVDELNAREHGHYVVIEMTISVNPRLSVWEGHEVSKKIKQQLMKQYHHVTHVYIHVNPYDAGYPYKQADVEASELPSVLH